MDEFLAILGRWENVAFLVPATVGILFMLLQLVGFGLDQLFAGGPEHEIDAGADHDVDAGTDVDSEHDLDLGEVGSDADLGDVGQEADAGEVGHDAEVAADHGIGGYAHDHHHVEPAGSGLLAAVLTWFNIGRAPFMVVFETLLIGFGVLGIGCTTALAELEGTRGWAALGLSFPVALVGAALLAKTVSGFFARHLPTFESKRVTARSLVGTVAEVTSERMDDGGGRALAQDAAGDLYTVFCRLAPGSPPARRGERVLLVSYRPDDDRYVAKPLAEPPGAPRPGATT